LKKISNKNPQLVNLTRLLRKKSREHKAGVWKVVSDFLEKPRRRRVAVNLSQLNRYTSDGDVVVVPGKTLGTGLLSHPLTVASFSFSKLVVEKIERAGGRCIGVEELVAENPGGKKVKVII
jgi:large subunit ribosomal protein L18e